MIDIEVLIKESLAGYTGEHANFILHAPAFYRLFINLLEDPQLPGRLRPLVLAVLAYFQLPVDIISEDLEGPLGFLDDIFLCAFAAREIQHRLSSDEILTGNWEGETAVIPLIRSILEQEETLIGDQRELILWYIGFEYLLD